MQVKTRPEMPSIVTFVSPYFIAQLIEIILSSLLLITKRYMMGWRGKAKCESEHTYTNEDSNLYSKEQSGGASDGPKSKISLVHTPQKYSPFIVHLQW